MELLPEETLSTSYLYRGKIINVRQDQVKMADGKKTFREIVEHPGAVAILALDDQERVVFVRQYRQSAGEILLEIPAGKIEPHEDPLHCARRELLEETGLVGESWKEVVWFYASPGFCDEKIYLFQAITLTAAVSPVQDPDEELRVVKVPLGEALQMVARGQVKDAKTIIALQYAFIQRNKNCC